MSTAIDFQPYTAEYKNFTVREVYEALEENGFELIRERWTDVDSTGKIVAGCVLAQTGLNLGVLMMGDDLLNDIEDWYNNQSEAIIHAQDANADQESSDIFDDVDYSEVDDPESIANKLSEETQDKVAQHSLEYQLNRFYLPNDSKWSRAPHTRSADAIIFWNDNSEIIDGKKAYVLPTYQDVAEMAYDILSPHFHETVTLAVKKYEFIKKEAVVA